MTITNWLFATMKQLGDAGVDSPRRDSLVLLEDTLGKDRAWVLANPEYKLNKQRLKQLEPLINRRIKREPLAYIRGKAWFWGRFFNVGPGVLVPRPETESFIDIIKNIRPKEIIDIGTGSGCLAITVKLELSETKVTATDMHEPALKLARQNARKHGVDIEFLKGNLLEPLLERQIPTNTAILANLPYVPESFDKSKELMREPETAWLSKKEGLDHYIRFWQQITSLSNLPSYVLTESLEIQHGALETMAQAAGYELMKTEGLVQLFSKSSN